ncbi:hypothetical protein VNO77_20164 [Canavalia gladiata]|uniref:Uncharacterized protein n=1 Tax=Canavalia gladiata TaxID=3824 RepID=A0AAN9LSP9_CANGL
MFQLHNKTTMQSQDERLRWCASTDILYTSYLHTNIQRVSIGGIRVNAEALFVVVVGPVRDLQILWECLERKRSQKIVYPRFLN